MKMIVLIATTALLLAVIEASAQSRPTPVAQTADTEAACGAVM